MRNRRRAIAVAAFLGLFALFAVTQVSAAAPAAEGADSKDASEASGAERPGEGMTKAGGVSNVPEDLASLSSAELVALEDRLTRDVQESDKALATLRADTKQLRQEQEEIDKDAQELAEAREEEAKKKEERDKELDAAKSDVQKKQASIARMSVRVTELKEQIDALEGKLVELSREKNETEKRYNDPTLVDVLDSRAATWGDVPRNVYNKTVNDLLPAFSRMSDYAHEYRRHVSRTSRALEILASLLVYGFVVGFIYLSYKIYGKVRGNLTVDRLLFLGDAFCAGFWFTILICYTFLFDDPLHVIQLRSPLFFFVFQLTVMTNYMMYVLLRILVLASQMSLKALGEVLAVIVVGQHYYVRVWQPAILDVNFSGTFFYYFCYAWMFSAFAYKRADHFSPLKQLNGPKLSLGASLRVMYNRMTGRSVPDGDLNTRLPPPGGYTPLAKDEPSSSGNDHIN